MVNKSDYLREDNDHSILSIYLTVFSASKLSLENGVAAHILNSNKSC